MLKKYLFFLFITSLHLFYFEHAQAQMFSVSSNQPATYTPSSAFYFALEPSVFTYRQTNPDVNRTLNFSGPIFRFRFELPGLQIYLGYNNRIGDNEDISYFNAGAKIDGQYIVYRRPEFFVTIPLVIKTDFTQVSSRFDVPGLENFQQSSALIGGGLLLHFRLHQQVRFQAKAIPQYGFSVTSFGGTGGNLGIIEAQTRLYFDNLLENWGLVLGYDYRKSVYDLEDDIFNYRLRNHSILLGVTF